MCLVQEEFVVEGRPPQPSSVVAILSESDELVEFLTDELVRIDDRIEIHVVSDAASLFSHIETANSVCHTYCVSTV